MSTPEERERQRLATLSNYYATFVGYPPGADVFEDLHKAYLMRESHTPGDPYTTAYCEGQRSVVLRIHQILAQVRTGLTRKDPHERTDDAPAE